MFLAAGVILLLIGLTALYVAAEFAAVGEPPQPAEAAGEDGNALAARVLPIVEDPQRARPLHRRLAGRDHAVEPRRSAPTPRRSSRPARRRCLAQLVGRSARDRRIGRQRRDPHLLTMLRSSSARLVPKTIALQHPTETRWPPRCPMLWSGRVYAWFIVILDRQLQPHALALRRAAGRRTVTCTRRKRSALLIADSRDGGLLEPQEQVRLHRALRLGPPRRAPADGAARTSRRHRARDAVARRPPHRGNRARTAACPSTAARSTTSPASSTPRTS